MLHPSRPLQMQQSTGDTERQGFSIVCIYAGWYHPSQHRRYGHVPRLHPEPLDAATVYRITHARGQQAQAPDPGSFTALLLERDFLGTDVAINAA